MIGVSHFVVKTPRSREMALVKMMMFAILKSSSLYHKYLKVNQIATVIHGSGTVRHKQSKENSLYKPLYTPRIIHYFGSTVNIMQSC